MEKVTDCVHELIELFSAIKLRKYDLVSQIAESISKREHAADLTKNDIRNHLPGSLFLSIDRGNFLEMLSLQDSIADKAEDIAVLTTLRPLELHKAFEEQFFLFLDKNIDSFEGARKIIQELHELLESSFGGAEAQKVKHMVEDVAFKEHEADLLQRELLKSFFQAEKDMTYGVYFHWLKVFESVGAISNLAEKLANCVRMTLDVK